MHPEHETQGLAWPVCKHLLCASLSSTSVSEHLLCGAGALRALGRGPGCFAMLGGRETGEESAEGSDPGREEGSRAAPALQGSQPGREVLAHSSGWGGLSGPSEPAPQD